MVPTTCCRLMAALVAAFIFSSSASLWAQGFPRGHRDALGPVMRPLHAKVSLHGIASVAQ